MPFLKTLFRGALCSIACGASLFCAADVYRIIRNYPELMPVSYMDEKGSPTGFETELIRKIAEQAQLDLKEEFVANFGDTLTALENGKADLAMATISVTPARQQIFDFTTPYFRANPFAFITKDDSIKTIQDLANKKVSVWTGSNHEQKIKEIQKEGTGSVIPAKSIFLAVKAVIQGEADAAVGDDAYMLNFADRYKQHNLKAVIDRSIEPESYAIAVRKGDQALKKKIDDALLQLKRDGTIDALTKKWYPNRT